MQKTNQQDLFYQQEFICGNSVLTRWYLEGLPCPFCTEGTTDSQMQTIIDQTDAETRALLGIPPGQPIDFSNDEQDDLWFSVLEDTVLRQRIPYYEDIFTAYHGTPNPEVKFSTEGGRVIYFTSDRDVAEGFAHAEGRGGLLPGEAPTIVHVKLVLRNSLVLATEEDWMRMADSTAIDKQQLIAQGYDSILCRNEKDVAYFVVFDSSDCQILKKEPIN